VRQEWSPEELLASWTLVDGDWDLVANKSGSTRLGFSLLLKFFELEGRFPDLLEEVSQAAVEYVAGLVKVPAAEFAKYDLTSRSAKNHRKQIREALKFRPATRADEEKLIAWLADEVCPVELVEDRLREALLVECRERSIEPPGRVDRIITAAQTRAEKALCARTIERLGDVGVARLLALVAEENEDGAALLASLKRDPGAVGLESLLTEITKLNDVRRLGLPDGLFTDCSEKLLAAWRARAIKMYPSDFRDTAEDVRITLLAALCSSRQAEITDALGDLLIALVQKINARAERRVERQLTAELMKVRGKEGILFKLADAAIGQPDELVRTALYPVVGEKTLRDLVAEAKANEKVFKAKVRTTLRSSYSNYYRQMLPPLLKTLGFRCNNTAYRPVMDALALTGEVRRHRRQDPLLRRRRHGADGRRRAQGLARGRRGRQGQGRAHPVRAVRAGGAAGRDPAPRDLHRGRWPLAEPGGRPARRLRGHPHRALRGDPSADGPAGVHRRPEAADDERPGPAVGRARGRLGGRGEGHHPARGAVDESAEVGEAGRAHRPDGAEGGGRTPLGCARSAGRAEERRLPHRLHRRVRLGRRV
jgi:hypothetical protein